MKLGKEQQLEQLEKVFIAAHSKIRRASRPSYASSWRRPWDNEDVLSRSTQSPRRSSGATPNTIRALTRLCVFRQGVCDETAEYYTTEGKGDQIVIDLPRDTTIRSSSVPTRSRCLNFFERSPNTERADSNGHATTAVADGHSQSKLSTPAQRQSGLGSLCGLFLLRASPY